MYTFVNVNDAGTKVFINTPIDDELVVLDKALYHLLR